MLRIAAQWLLVFYTFAFAGAEEFYYPGPPDAPLAPRSALVIGIPIYNEATFPRLPNAARDVERLRDVLTKLGFDVHPKADPTPVTRQKLKRLLYDYVKHVKKTGGASLIYFAGHGLAYGQQSYLVPHDAMAIYSRDLREELIPLDLISDALKEMRDVLHIVILDACRSPGLGRLLPIGSGDIVEATAGVKFRPPSTTIYSTSADDGQKARDGNPGENSPFAHALMTYMQAPHEHIDMTFRKIAHYFQNPPFNSPENPQEPTYHNRTLVHFFFAPTRKTYDDEKLAWDAIDHDRAHAEIYQGFLQNFPAGYFAGQARVRKNRARPLEMAQRKQRVIVNADVVRLRGDQSEVGTDIKGTYNKGTRAVAFFVSQDWTFVQMPDGKLGYMKSSFLSPAPTTEARVTLRYTAGSDDPPEEFNSFLDGLATRELEHIRITGRFEPVSQGLSAARITKVQAKLLERNISAGIVEVTLASAENPSQLNEVEVTATVLGPPGS